MKFKIGDKVKINRHIDTYTKYTHDYLDNEVYSISLIDDTAIYLIDVNNINLGAYVYHNEIDLYVERKKGILVETKELKL